MPTRSSPYSHWLRTYHSLNASMRATGWEARRLYAHAHHMRNSTSQASSRTNSSREQNVLVTSSSLRTAQYAKILFKCVARGFVSTSVGVHPARLSACLTAKRGTSSSSSQCANGVDSTGRKYLYRSNLAEKSEITCQQPVPSKVLLHTQRLRVL